MFDVNDKVKVVKKVEDYFGEWHPNMDYTIGEEYTILEIDLQNEDCKLDNDFWYPFEALELVKENVMWETNAWTVETKKNEISTFIRKNGKPYGFFVGKVNPHKENEYIISFSLCNKRDQFSKKTAKSIAMNRFNKIAPDAFIEYCVIPDSIWSEFEKFEQRCERYFKGCTLYMEYLSARQIVG